MFLKVDKKNFWVPDDFSLEQTVDYIIKKIAPWKEKYNREKYRKVVENQIK